MSLDKSIKYFLGANSPDGFFSYFDQIIDYETANRLYIIKGGPGTGKSSFMRKIAEAGAAKGHAVELIYCSSDPNSLDGIVFPKLKIAFADGTAPHILDPVFPGAVDEIINLGEFWDESALRREKANIIKLSLEISQNFAKAYRFIGAAGFVQKDSCGALASSLDVNKLTKYSERQCKKLFAPTGKHGKEIKRFLSGITPYGTISYIDSLTKNSKEIIVIEDKLGLSNLLLTNLRNGGIAAGYTVISYYCPMAPDTKLEHIYIEELSLAIITSDDFHPYSGDFTKRIFTTRFIEKEPACGAKSRVRFNKKCEKSLLSGAVSSLKEAITLHDELEKYYVAAMDFSKSDALAKKICGEIF